MDSGLVKRLSLFSQQNLALLSGGMLWVRQRVVEDSGFYKVYLDLPSFSLTHLQVSVEGLRLIISYNFPLAVAGGRVRQVLARVLLNVLVDAAHVTAHWSGDGVLCISLPKRPGLNLRVPISY